MTLALHPDAREPEVASLSLRERTYAEQRAHVGKRLKLLLSELGFDPSHGLRIADIGCGKGYWLRTFLDWGFDPGNAVGIDIDAPRLHLASAEAPGVKLVRADCQRIPLPDTSFDVVSQFTLFTSLLEPESRIATAKEMSRIVKPGGLIVWYDFFAPNPMNPRTRPVGRKEIAELFSGRTIHCERLTFAVPVARLLARVSPRVAAAANRSDYLATHFLALIQSAHPEGPPVGGTA